MKQVFNEPRLESLGHVRDLTAQTGSPTNVDVPLGTPLGIPGGIIGSM